MICHKPPAGTAAESWQQRLVVERYIFRFGPGHCLRGLDDQNRFINAIREIRFKAKAVALKCRPGAD